MFQEYYDRIERMYQLFATCPDPNKREREGGWTIKQIAGHLVDSASNNHQRFLRYQPQGTFAFPGYDQNACVSRAHYDSMEFQSLLALWHHYNRMLLHIIDHIPADDLATSMLQIGDRPAVALQDLIRDYFVHMGKHEQQVKRIIAA